MFEEQDDALALYARHHIRVGKIQVSAALSCHGAPKELAELAQFAENRYLHQTCVLAGSGDVRDQLRLTFPTLEAAQGYAAREGISFHIVPAPARTLKLQAYADNFR
jgi:hypothetical protein